MRVPRCAFFSLIHVSVLLGQGANVTGQWSTGAGGSYTLDERGNGKIAVIPGSYQKPTGYGWLERTQTAGGLEGEAVSFGCWFQLSLTESQDGSMLSGTLRINAKKSTRRCRSFLTKEGKAGVPNPITLFRQSSHPK